MIALKKILVATDFSEPADAAVDYGRAFARTFGATLYLLHVVDDMYVRLGGDAQSLRVEAVITSGATAQAIVEYAEKENVQLIVVGTHGRGGVAKLLMGSVAERVVRTAHCPVLTVRRPERDFVMPDAVVASAHV